MRIPAWQFHARELTHFWPLPQSTHRSNFRRFSNFDDGDDNNDNDDDGDIRRKLSSPLSRSLSVCLSVRPFAWLYSRFLIKFSLTLSPLSLPLSSILSLSLFLSLFFLSFSHALPSFSLSFSLKARKACMSWQKMICFYFCWQSTLESSPFVRVNESKKFLANIHSLVEWWIWMKTVLLDCQSNELETFQCDANTTWNCNAHLMESTS